MFASPNASPYVKDGFDGYLVHDRQNAVNPLQTGTKAAPHYQLSVEAGSSETICLRLSRSAPVVGGDTFADFDEVFRSRVAEADEFYAALTPGAIQADQDRVNVMRQALAGMLWTKQYFYYDVDKWLEEHHVPRDQRKQLRNGEWFHMLNDDIISMPDKWEYPWYAAWDLAFHVLPLAIVDHDFAKAQLDLMLRNDYLHPNGQIPAYEWNFGDVNPPVHAYATMQIYQMDKEGNDGKGDIEFLKYAFAKLLVNFTWWVNRKDRSGDRVSIGGSVGWNVFDQKRTELVSIRTDDFNGDISGTQFRDINSFPFMATAHCYIGATDGTHVYFGGRAGVYYVKQRLEIGTVAFEVKGWQFGVAPEVGLIAPLGYSTRFIANVQYNLPFSSGTFLGGESRSWQSIGFNVGVAFGGH